MTQIFAEQDIRQALDELVEQERRRRTGICFRGRITIPDHELPSEKARLPKPKPSVKLKIKRTGDWSI